eukprot:1158899-Pelagomonas_calceolata.AAC.4
MPFMSRMQEGELGPYKGYCSTGPKFGCPSAAGCRVENEGLTMYMHRDPSSSLPKLDALQEQENENALHHFCFHTSMYVCCLCVLAGRPICKLHLPPGELHADVNGDGIMDHVQYGSGKQYTWSLLPAVSRTRGNQSKKAAQTVSVPPSSWLP